MGQIGLKTKLFSGSNFKEISSGMEAMRYSGYRETLGENPMQGNFIRNFETHSEIFIRRPGEFFPLIAISR